MAKLEILSGKREGSIVDLDDGEFDVGNRKSAQISIRDPWISYNHARISGSGGRYVIEDLGSSNGTWINGEKIQRQELSGSLLIYFGKTKTRFRGKVAPANEQAAKGGDQPWWDKVIQEEGEGAQPDGATRARLKRLEAELAEERGMRKSLERFFDLPEGTRVEDAAKAGELKAQVEELERKLKDAEKGGGADVEAAVAEATEVLRREHMSKVVELEARATKAESKLSEKEEQAQRELERVKSSLQAELDELRESLESARKAAGGEGDDAGSQERIGELEKELAEARDKTRELEESVAKLTQDLENAGSASGGEEGEDTETLKTQLWAAVEEATRWKEETRQAKDSLEEAQAEADKAKAEHAQIVQEIDEISMEQIEIEEELNLKVQILREQLVEASGKSEAEINEELAAAVLADEPEA